LRQKVRRGEQSGVAPTGYLNDKANHKIIPDPERFHLVRKLFELYATGEYSLKELRDKITSLGLTSRTGKVLTVSNIQMILKILFTTELFISTLNYTKEFTSQRLQRNFLTSARRLWRKKPTK